MKLRGFSSCLIAFSMLSCLTVGELRAASQNNSNGFFSRLGKEEKKKDKPKEEKPKNLFLIEAGAVYLRPYQGGTDFASFLSADELNSTQGEPYGTNRALDFDYDWGFRAGLGYQFGKSRQVINATYMYLAADAHKSTTSGPPSTSVSTTITQDGSVVGGSSIGGFFTAAHSSWHLHFNMLDLTFGKKYAKKGCMNFEPFIGLKGILLTENQEYHYINSQTNGLSTKLKQTVDFKGAGVMGGLSLDWAMTKWLSFIGMLDGALLYSSIETKRKGDNQLPTVLWIGKSTDIKGTPVLDAMFALRGVYCFKKGQFIDLKIGFEEHYVFETMKHFLYNSDSNTDLSLMGWFATLGFGF